MTSYYDVIHITPCWSKTQSVAFYAMGLSVLSGLVLSDDCPSPPSDKETGQSSQPAAAWNNHPCAVTGCHLTCASLRTVLFEPNTATQLVHLCTDCVLRLSTVVPYVLGL